MRGLQLMVVLALAVSACTAEPVSTGGVGLEEDLELHRALWEANEPQRYSLTVERRCFCPPGRGGPFTVTVRDGVPVTVFRGDEQVPADDPSLPLESLTVDGLFDLVERKLDGDFLAVIYDDDMGFPRVIDSDPLQHAIDDELLVIVNCC